MHYYKYRLDYLQERKGEGTTREEKLIIIASFKESVRLIQKQQDNPVVTNFKRARLVMTFKSLSVFDHHISLGVLSKEHLVFLVIHIRLV